MTDRRRENVLQSDHRASRLFNATVLVSVTLLRYSYVHDNDTFARSFRK